MGGRPPALAAEPPAMAGCSLAVVSAKSQRLPSAIPTATRAVSATRASDAALSLQGGSSQAATAVSHCDDCWAPADPLSIPQASSSLSPSSVPPCDEVLLGGGQSSGAGITGSQRECRPTSECEEPPTARSMNRADSVRLASAMAGIKVGGLATGRPAPLPSIGFSSRKGGGAPTPGITPYLLRQTPPRTVTKPKELGPPPHRAASIYLTIAGRPLREDLRASQERHQSSPDWQCRPGLRVS